LSYFILKYLFRFLFIAVLVKSIEKQKEKVLNTLNDLKKKGEESKKNV